MSLIEQATQRLAELARAGVPTPFAALPPLDDAHGAQQPAALPLREAHVGPSGLRQVRPGSPSARRHAGRHSQRVDLDLARLHQAGYFVPHLSETRIANEFRHLKRVLIRNIEAAASDAERRRALIMVTSALAGEGKTFCSVNLAMSLATEIDRSVLLVDVDVVQPAVLPRLGLAPRKGLLDALVDPQLDLSEVIVATNVPKLSILPTGTVTGKASELLASVAMDELLLELTTRYSDRVIVLDAPPLLLTTGASTLASRVGQIVMVIEASRTPRDSVLQAFAILDEYPIVLSVLNKCSARMAARNYGYYGGTPGRSARE